MAAVKHEIPHDLDMETAKKAARKAVEAYAARFTDYDFKSKWVNDTRVELGFTAATRRLEGAMEVQARALVLHLEVPFVFRIFSGKAVEIIEREARVWLDKAKKGELD